MKRGVLSRHLAVPGSTIEMTISGRLLAPWCVAVALCAGCGGRSLETGRDAGGDLPPATIGHDAPGPAEAGSSIPEPGVDAGSDVPATTDLLVVEPEAGVGPDVASAVVDAGRDASLEDGGAYDGGAVEVSAHDTPPQYLGTLQLRNMGDWPAVAMAPDGSTFFAGSFRIATDFDPGPGTDRRTPHGVSDAFVTKLNADGSYAWTLTFGGAASQTFATTMAVSDDAIVVAGGFTADVDFDPGAAVQSRHAGDPDQYAGFVLKLTRAGAFVWVSAFQGTADCMGRSLALDADGSVYVGGGFSSLCDFDPGPGVDQHLAFFNENGFLVKLGADDGHEAWLRTLAGDACAGYVQSITLSSDGRVWATGAVSASCTFGGSAAPATTGDQAALLVSVTPAGDVRGFWSINGATGFAIADAPDGSIYVSGAVAGVAVVDFDPGTGVANRTVPSGDRDTTGFVLKLGSTAAFRWVQLLSHATAVGLAATDEGGVLCLVAPVPDEQQTTAIIITKLAANQMSAWSVSVPGTGGGAESIAAGSSTFAIAGIVDSDISGLDVEPGPGVDVVQGGSTFLSRYSF
jgi:hypothetical protein